MTLIKKPLKIASSAVDPQVRDRVSEMLSTIERDGMDAVRRYSRELDDWDPASFEVTADEAQATAGLDPKLRESIDFGIEQVAASPPASSPPLPTSRPRPCPGWSSGSGRSRSLTSAPTRPPGGCRCSPARS
ncbi:histidinol dehydrogenase [Actinomadura luteofluorescens]|uniref:histidinol dehydrogenase n=1 Tax=Actinomadura luteofluorescens TaxID=46163 RepID=UPI003634575E